MNESEINALVEETHILREKFQKLVPNKNDRFTGKYHLSVKAEAEAISKEMLVKFVIAKAEGINLLSLMFPNTRKKED